MAPEKKQPPPASSPSGKGTPTSKTSGGDAASQSMEAMAKAMGLDPRKFDPSMLAAIGLDPKKMDPMTMAALGLDPKNPNASLMAAMAAMYGYGLNPAMMAGIPGMEMFLGTKAKTSSTTT